MKLKKCSCQFYYTFPKTLSEKYKRQIQRAAKTTFLTLPKNRLLRLKKGLSYDLSISVVNDSQIKRLNHLYRQKNRATDVLAFSRLEGKQLPTAQPEIGEIILALPTAKRQAREYGSLLEEELARLTVHGVLHLFGYDHERSKREEAIMFRLQDKILAQVLKKTRQP